MTQLDHILDPVNNLYTPRRHQLPNIATLDKAILSKQLLHVLRLLQISLGHAGPCEADLTADGLIGCQIAAFGLTYKLEEDVSKGSTHFARCRVLGKLDGQAACGFSLAVALDHRASKCSPGKVLHLWL